MESRTPARVSERTDESGEMDESKRQNKRRIEGTFTEEEDAQLIIDVKAAFQKASAIGTEIQSSVTCASVIEKVHALHVCLMRAPRLRGWMRAKVGVRLADAGHHVEAQIFAMDPDILMSHIAQASDSGSAMGTRFPISTPSLAHASPDHVDLSDCHGETGPMGIEDPTEPEWRSMWIGIVRRVTEDDLEGCFQLVRTPQNKK